VVGFCYFMGEGIRRDMAEGARWYRRAARKGHEIAMANLGLCYLAGEGVPRNRARARQWFRKAIAAGNERAREFLAEASAR